MCDQLFIKCMQVPNDTRHDILLTAPGGPDEIMVSRVVAAEEFPCHLERARCTMCDYISQSCEQSMYKLRQILIAKSTSHRDVVELNKLVLDGLEQCRKK